jgi:hypothetical protein
MERNAFLSMDNNRKIAASESVPLGGVKAVTKKVEDRSGASKSASSIVAGGFAGILAKTAVAPVERIKILFQVTSEQFSIRKFFSTMGHIRETEGSHSERCTVFMRIPMKCIFFCLLQDFARFGRDIVQLL